MAFADTIKELPFAATTTSGRGFLPPIFRASMHVLYLLGCSADEKVEVSLEEALTELRQAEEHWNARAEIPAISNLSLAKGKTMATAFNQAIKEYENWTPDARIANLRELAHRIAQYAADLDRELTGIRDSDPGTSM